MNLKSIVALVTAASLAAGAFALPACAAFATHLDRAKQTGQTTAKPSASLGAAIQAAVEASGLKNATIGVSVREVGSGAAITDLNGARLMTPASNMKVLTTAAALRVLGADWKFSTRLVRNGDRLTVIADGDPSLGDPEILDEVTYTDAAGVKKQGLTTEELIDIWAAAAKRAGITQVRELVVDDRIFDREFTHPGWPADQLDEKYCAEIAGLTFNVNLLQGRVTAASSRPEISAWTPAAPWLEVDTSKVTATNGKDSKQSIWIGRTDSPWRFTLNGNMKTTPVEPIAVCVRDMPTFFARYVSERMRLAGVSVASTRVATAADPAASASGAVTGDTVGPPITSALARVVKQCNTESQNLYAESLLKRIGAKRSGQSGTWANGAAALVAEVDAALGAGTAAKGLVVSDGSGLCKDDRVSPNLMTAWLRATANDPKISQAFINSMAVAGVSGTVQKRFKGLDTEHVFVPCKTGYINGVCCLSGFVGRPGETPRFAFSVLCNDLTKDKDGVGKAKALQEKIVMILAAGM
ncbi:MAG: D-alanyl-D-alanine carboxypeptidase/D-alanyl-D-alanine-endopeptidase [Planctomycetota bacterium]|nr:D-alanyl-D-alanine carboxypeptidase/D-alanyl-D-alanine-endopeptidase [Planctomycetota bacterium]